MKDAYTRPSRVATSSPRWRWLRREALRRDDYQCVKCGHRGRLEADHIKPVRTHPHLAFSLANLQALCARCHAKKTRVEIGLAPQPDPRREQWREFVLELLTPKQKDTIRCWRA